MEDRYVSSFITTSVGDAQQRVELWKMFEYLGAGEWCPVQTFLQLPDGTAVNRLEQGHYQTLGGKLLWSEGLDAP